MKNICTPLLTALAFFIGAIFNHAEILFFPPNDWPDEDWTVSSVGGTPIVGSVTLQEKTWLQIARAASPNTGSAQVMYNGIDAQLNDIKGSVIFGIDTISTYGSGIILRSQSTAISQTNAYYLAVTPNVSGSAKLELYWGVGNGFLSGGTLLASETLSISLGTLDATHNNQYLLEFSFVGNKLDASLASWDTVNEQKGIDLASLSYTDMRLEARSEGYFGIRGGRYGSEVATYFRDLEITAIPEPATTAFLLLPAGYLLLHFGRKPGTQCCPK